MPPKKDKKKGEGPALKEVDPTVYVRKATSLPEPDIEKQLPLPSTTGKIINVETIFPEWKDSDPPEVWSEPIPPEKVPQIKYPKWLTVEKTVNFTQFYELDVSDAPVDPKAKKKDPPKKPAGKGKGVEEPTEMVELSVNDLGKQLPVVYRDDGQEDFKTYPPMKSFSQKPIAQSNETDNAEVLDDVDPLVCDAFRIISTFVPRVITDSEHQHKLEHNSKLSSLDANYLWRSIYPKLPNGKPCYNPAGKYCVKVYFAGKWRKVYVDDTIPLTADGKPAIAFSADRYELWPLLLSKAIYTVYSATGYTFADEFSEAMIANHPELSLPLLASQFVAFIVHIFTGWQNHQSVDAATIFQKEKSKSIHMLNYMVNNGIPLIDYDDIVGEDPSFRFASEEPPPHLTKLNKRGSVSSLDYEDTGNGIEGEYDYENQSAPSSPSNRKTNNHVLKTKRKFKEEYTQRKQIRDDIVAAIETREQKVNNVTQTLLKGSLEVFFFVKFDIPVQRYRVYPLLGLAYDHNELPSHTNLLNIQFLSHWQRLPLEDTIPNVDDPIILGQGRIPVPEFLVPFPKASPIRYLWHSAGELMKENAFLTGLFTNIDTPYSVECSRHWVSTAPPEPVNPDPKAKDKKAKDPKGAPPPVIEEKFIDPGSMPITFLRVDTASICDEIEADFQGNDAEPITDDPTPRELDNETRDAIADQQDELNRVQSDPNSLKSENASMKNSESKTDVKFHNYEKNQSTIQKFSIKLVVTLMADITSEVVTTNPTRTSTMTNAATGAMMLGRQSSMHWDDSSGGQNRIHPSDTVVLLQEVRWEEDDAHHTPPLMFIVHMRDTAHLPMISKVFTIPFDRITSREPMLFWVRVFTRSSVYFNVAANVNVELNSAEKIWSESLGFSAIVKEGDSEVCVQDTEQLLFRCPVQVRKKTPALIENPSTDVILNPTASEASLHSPRMLIFLHVKDFPIEQLLQLLLVNINTTNQDTEVIQISHPLGQILPISFQADFLPQLIAFITPQTLAAGGTQQQIPKFHWKLLVLSKDQLTEPENPIQEAPIRHRFKGKYIANNKQCIFRDVYTIERSSFPIALKLTVFPWEYDHPNVSVMETNPNDDTASSTIIPGESKENINSNEIITASRSGPLDEVDSYDVEYIFRIYRKSDSKLIGEYGTNNILHIYSIPLKPFLPDGEDENTKVNAAPDPKAGKAAAGGKGGGKGKGEVGINPNDVVDVIVECIVDNQRMAVPNSWNSSFPHVFDEFFPNQPGETSDAISFYQETLNFQKSYLKVKPPEKPLLSWKLDFLSGKVHGVSHDITNTLKYYEVKKSWDQLDPPGNTLSSNRLERAVAAANFIREREEWKRDPYSENRPTSSSASNKASTATLSRPASKQEQQRPASSISNRNATPSQDISTRASIQMSTAMVESLSQALGLENEEVKNRFNTLNQAKKIEEKVEVIPDINLESSLIYPHNPRTRLGSEMWHESVSSRRLEEKQKLEDYYQKLVDKSKELTSVYRNSCAERINVLSQEYLSQRNDLLAIWKEREAYRQEVEIKNASLNYLLKRGKDARTTAKQQEDAAEAERLKAEAKAAKSNKKK